MRKSSLFLLATCLFIASCKSPAPDPTVLLDSNPQIVVRNEVKFSYREADCQLGFNRSKAEFRMMTDNMSSHAIIVLNDIPTEKGQRVVAERISWTTHNDIESRNNVALEVLKIEGGNIWLWSAREEIAAVVSILE